MTQRLRLTALLVFMGASWGLTQPLTKIAVSDGYRHFGLIFWSEAIAATILGAILAGQGKRLPLNPRQLGFYLAIALLGMILPAVAGYEAARHLPAGVLSLVIAAVPMFALPIALALGIDRFSGLRLLGLVCGLGGVALLTGPGDNLSGVSLPWLLIALITPFFYGLEGNFVAKCGTGGAGTLELLCGASLVGMAITGPLAWVTGHWIDPRPPWGLPDAALVGSAVINALIYALYVWLVQRAGPVFAGQVSYLVTGFGVIWAMIVLGESYATGFWAALALMLAGLFLVQPRESAPLAQLRGPGEDGAI
ncbi:MAG: DMT family transporter [Paracoccaceae bacterium]